MSAKQYTVQRPTVAHVMVALAFGYEPLPVLVQRKHGKTYGTMSVERYLHFQSRGELP